MVESIAEFANEPKAQVGAKRSRTQAHEDNPRVVKKRARTVALEALEQLPSGKRYEKSFMHRDVVSHVLVSQKHGMVFTGSVDGHLKFWKKGQVNLEFIKTFKAHLHKITGMALTPNEQRLATVSELEQSVKLFDVENFDVIHFIRVGFAPGECAFVSKVSSFSPVLAVAETAPQQTAAQDGEEGKIEEGASGGVIRLVKVEQVSSSLGQNQVVPSIALTELHESQVRLIKFNQELDLVVSTDQSGTIEIWDPETHEMPENDDRLQFELLSETDYYSLASDETFALAMEFSPDWKLLAIFCRDCKIRIFHFASGRLLNIIDESISALTAMQEAEQPDELVHVENQADFQAKMQGYKEAMRQWDTLEASSMPGLAFDKTSSLLIHSSPIGVKTVNFASGKVLRVQGSSEQDYFLSVALYQGEKTKTTVPTQASQKQLSALADLPDPLIICSASRKVRFYTFARREPSETDIDKVGRDLMNERLNNAQNSGNAQQQKQVKEVSLPNKAVIYTSMGEIHLELYGTECPLTVENFTTHAKNGYYDNKIFHRVVKGFMVQTGCPEGTGTEGESIWGGEFQDEIRPGLTHTEPGTLSMANCGKNTNASQFYITTVPCNWLDGKHTVFGKVTRGMEVVTDIEKVRVDKEHKPLMDVKMHSIRVKQEPTTAATTDV